MKQLLSTGAALLMTTSMASAVGLDRSNQDISIIFEGGNYAQLSYGSTSPSVSGTDVAAFGGAASGNVGLDYQQVALGVKFEASPQISIGVIFDQPYGVDVSYPTAADGGSVALGGTEALVDSSALTLVGRYQFNENFSVHAGIRRQTIDADVTLSGAAYGGLSGYNASFASGSEVGYLVGAAYERPDIALRLAITYYSEMTYNLATTETLNGAPIAPVTDTEIVTPEAINIDFQTGIAADTLLFGSIRWADYESLIVSPTAFAGATGGGSLTDLESKAEYTIGVGRRFNDQFSASIQVGYEPEGEDDLVSPLAPTNGKTSLRLAGSYNVNEDVTIAGGIQYTWLGDAQAQTADTGRAAFTDNTALSVGIRVGFSF